MPDPEFKPGFRISPLDGLVLLAGGVAVVGLGWTHATAALVIGFVVGHFFLFCNVFRISRPLELIWTGVFVALAAMTITAGLPGWGAAMGISLVVTGIVIVVEMRKPSYHGVGWRQINPGLREWWESDRKNNRVENSS